MWPTTRGIGVIAFVIDTEDSATHEAVAPSTMGVYCKRFTNEPLSTKTAKGHGLHVADTILQVAPETKIVFLKGLTNEGSGYNTWIGDAIRYVADLELLPEHEGFKKVINLSLGSNSSSPVMKQAIQYARDRDVEVFAAAGNDGNDVDYPGAYSDLVTTISAIDERGNPASFTSRGVQVDLACPGVEIQGAWKDGYASLSGTSMATPHAVGIACLILSSVTTNIDLDVFLILNATDIHQDGKDNETGYGVPFAPNYFNDDPTEPPNPEPEPIKLNLPPWAWVAIGGSVIGLGLLLLL